jgi:DNA-binding transcriptional regulator YdaS (Cro superfamily)
MTRTVNAKNRPSTDAEIVAMVVRKAGSLRALGRALGISYQAIQGWHRIPADRIVTIEKALGIRRELMRPDLYK